MTTVLLNIIGLLCIIISLVCIKKISKEEKSIYERIISIDNDIKFYSDTIENTVKEFDNLIGVSLNKIENIQNTYPQDIKQDTKKEKAEDVLREKDNKKYVDKNILSNINKKEDKNKEIYENIIQLKKYGLSNKEIAKKLNKGVREVEIIIKMLKNI